MHTCMVRTSTAQAVDCFEVVTICTCAMCMLPTSNAQAVIALKLWLYVHVHASNAQAVIALRLWQYAHVHASNFHCRLLWGWDGMHTCKQWFKDIHCVHKLLDCFEVIMVCRCCAPLLQLYDKETCWNVQQANNIWFMFNICCRHCVHASLSKDMSDL